MIIETKFEFAEFEYLPEFVQQYMNYTVYKGNPNYMLYNFAKDTYRDFDKGIDVDKAVDEYGSFYRYMYENNIYDGESSVIYDFIEWLPDTYHVTEYDDTNNNVYFKVSLIELVDEHNERYCCGDDDDDE